MAEGSTRRSIMLGTALAAAQPRPGDARTPAPAGSPTARANGGTVGLVSGGVDGTYIRIAADLASVLDDGDVLRVLPIVGKGSVQNLADLIYLRGIDVGIVQSDALTYVRRENMFPGVGQAINYIAKLYDEEVHILSRREIAGVEDLAGKKVNVDVRGSGTAMTAAVVFGKLNVAVQPVYEPQDVALQRLRTGEIAALVYVAGKPARLFASLPADTQLHFLPLAATPDLIETYLPSQLGHDAYPALVAAGAPVETLAVGAVMAVYGWTPGSERYRKVARFVAALSEKFALLQQPPRHPKWREVALAARVPGWTRFVVEPPAEVAVPGPRRGRL